LRETTITRRVIAACFADLHGAEQLLQLIRDAHLRWTVDRRVVFKLQNERSELGSTEEALQQGVEIASCALILEADESRVVPMAANLQPRAST